MVQSRIGFSKCDIARKQCIMIKVAGNKKWLVKSSSCAKDCMLRLISLQGLTLVSPDLSIRVQTLFLTRDTNDL